MTSDAGGSPAPKRAKVEDEASVEAPIEAPAEAPVEAPVEAPAEAAEEVPTKTKRSLISLPKGGASKADAAASSSLEPAVDVSSVFQKHVLEDAAVPSRRESFSQSSPYGHCVIDGLVDDALLREVREEVIGNLEATYKETDLFKMFQTGDLANLSGLDEASKKRLPALLKLRAALASEAFRDLARKVTGCGELSTVLDGAANVHADGGHLLCHDDVIGDRAVSFILYLVDPDAPWTAEDGGALELYPTERDDPTVPTPNPSASLLPKWNRLAMFAVQPGKSFHSIQEVTSGGRPRLSIQGWLHAAHVPEQAELATLKKLQEKQAEGGGDEGEIRGFAQVPVAEVEEEKEEESTSGKQAKEEPTASSAASTAAISLPASFPAPPPASSPAGSLASDFTASELALLRAFVNPAYLREDVWKKVHAKFVEDGSVQLRTFLLPRLAQAIARSTLQADRREKAGAYEGWEKDYPDVPEGHPRPCPGYDLGVGDGWAAVGPAFKQRFLVYGGEADLEALLKADGQTAVENPGRFLAAVRDALFGSTAFAKLLKKLTDVGFTAWSGRVRRFRAGSDYTVAHYGLLTHDPRLDASLCFVDESSPDVSELWQSGEVGGFEAYVLADEEDEAAEVYRRDDEQESGVLNVSAAGNVLSLVLRDEGLMRFVKYVSAQAPGSRWDIAAQFRPEPDEEDDEDDKEKNKDE